MVADRQTLPNEFATRLRVWRAYRGLTQMDVASRVETTQATISRIENGRKPGLNLQNRLANLLSEKLEDSPTAESDIVGVVANSSEFRAFVERIIQEIR